MATPVIMPKQGQTVESCIITNWKKQPGDAIAAGEAICEVETDKALLDVESPASGVVLALFFAEGDDVPVLTHIAAIGEPGESADPLRPDGAAAAPPPEPAAAVEAAPRRVTGISPRARKLAHRHGVDISDIAGSGPHGRIIERDVQALVARQPAMSPLARTMLSQGGYTAPERGSGVQGRIMAADLSPVQPEAAPPPEEKAEEDEVTTIPVQGIRQLIAERMLQSLQTTAQLTLNASADARAILEYRRRLKASAEEWGLQKVTINDLLLFAVSRILPRYPELNALFTEENIHRYKNVHLALAVDTPRGLMVPVIRQANSLSLKQISTQARQLASACQEGRIDPDRLSGGTFTVTNLGHLGIESFTPVLNLPQVAILGVGGLNLKPLEVEGQVEFVPHLGLSLTINHQVVDGAPAARFLQALCQGVAQLELLLAT